MFWLLSDMLSVRRVQARIESLESLNELLAPTPYRHPRLVGRGGMGTVYSVEHERLGRRFALKLIHERLAAEPQYVDRVRVEAEALARLEHPNVVEIVDFWIAAKGRPCVVMELLVGRTLSAELRERKRLPVREAVGIACQVLSGLAAAHQIGIVHRDVKPENLFLHQVPAHGTVVKLLDFGVARVLPNVSSRAPLPLSVPTTTDAIVGSPRFISPEGRRGERLDARADVYSTGLVLYTMLAGIGPFDGGALSPVAPSVLAGNHVPPVLDRIALRAIEERADDRYQTVAAFLGELRLMAPPKRGV